MKEAALMEDIHRTQRKVVLDVFEHEPVISEELIDMLALATPHIAGYSLEGKARGTQMIYEAFVKSLDTTLISVLKLSYLHAKTIFQDMI